MYSCTGTKSIRKAYATVWKGLFLVCWIAKYSTSTLQKRLCSKLHVIPLLQKWCNTSSIYITFHAYHKKLPAMVKGEQECKFYTISIIFTLYSLLLLVFLTHKPRHDTFGFIKWNFLYTKKKDLNSRQPQQRLKSLINNDKQATEERWLLTHQMLSETSKHVYASYYFQYKQTTSYRTKEWHVIFYILIVEHVTM